MTKFDIVAAVQKKYDMSLKAAAEAVDTVFDAMSEALDRGERIEIRGFGSFTMRDYDEYTGRNPKTGESIVVSPKKVPFFKVGKELKEMVAAG